MPKPVSITKREFSYWERLAIEKLVDGCRRSWDEIARDKTYAFKDVCECRLMFRDFYAPGHPISDKVHRAAIGLLEEYGIPYEIVFPKGEMPKISAQYIRAAVNRRKAFWRFILDPYC